MKKKAKYLGVSCYYDPETREITGRTKLSALVLYFAIILDNKLSWIHWKITGRNRMGTIQIFEVPDTNWFPWEYILIWLVCLIFYALLGGKVLLALFFISFLICCFAIIKYIIKEWE